MADQESNNVTKEQDRRGVGMLTNTLSSLAILKVNIDHGTDYLDYLRPFILHVLIEENPERIHRPYRQRTYLVILWVEDT